MPKCNPKPTVAAAPLPKKELKGAAPAAAVTNAKIFLACALLAVAVGAVSLLTAADVSAKTTVSAVTNQTVLNAVNKIASDIKSAIKDSNWTYVYGPDKNSQQNLDNLVNTIKAGADVKVMVFGGTYLKCNNVSLGVNQDTGKTMVKCIASQNLSVNGNTYSKDLQYKLIMDSAVSGGNYEADYVIINVDGKIVDGKTDSSVDNTMKWYIRK